MSLASCNNYDSVWLNSMKCMRKRSASNKHVIVHHNYIISHAHTRGHYELCSCKRNYKSVWRSSMRIVPETLFLKSTVWRSQVLPRLTLIVRDLPGEDLITFSLQVALRSLVCWCKGHGWTVWQPWLACLSSCFSLSLLLSVAKHKVRRSIL